MGAVTTCIGVWGQRAAIVINLYYEDEREKARENSLANLKQNADSPEVGGRETHPTSGKVAETLAKKAGIGRSSMEYLLAVKRSRPDLFKYEQLDGDTAEINAYIPKGVSNEWQEKQYSRLGGGCRASVIIPKNTDLKDIEIGSGGAKRNAELHDSMRINSLRCTKNSERRLSQNSD